MKLGDTFQHKNEIPLKIKACLRGKGYTKISFAKKTGISLTALEEFLNGKPTNYEKQLKEILQALDLSYEELLSYQVEQPCETPKNTENEWKRSEKAEKQYELLLDVIDLCGIYY